MIKIKSRTAKGKWFTTELKAIQVIAGKIYFIPGNKQFQHLRLNPENCIIILPKGAQGYFPLFNPIISNAKEPKLVRWAEDKFPQMKELISTTTNIADLIKAYQALRKERNELKTLVEILTKK